MNRIRNGYFDPKMHWPQGYVNGNMLKV